MGGKESKHFPITPDEALKRVTEAEKRHIQDNFRRLSSASGNLGKQQFTRSVLGESFPTNLGEAIFNLCGGSNKSVGLSHKETLTVLVLIVKGTKEEKTKFIFGLLCNENNTHIERGELLRFLKDLEPDFDARDIHSLFRDHDKVNYDTFVHWLETHPKALTVAEWLLTPDNPPTLISKGENTPTFYQTLAGVTHLEEQEIVELEKRFWELTSSSGSGRVDLSVIKPLISPPLPANLVSSFFSAFDENQDGHVDFKELSCGVSAACRGPEMERQKFCFKIFDSDRDGTLNKSEITVMCNSLVEVKRQLYPDGSEAETNASELISQLLSQSECLSMAEYLVWTVNNSYTTEFARLLFHLCHIVLGLRPSSRAEEGDIVRGWLERERSLPRVVGSLWHLININWWKSWQTYVNQEDSPITNKKTTPTSMDTIKRGTKKTASVEATVASDADRAVVGTSYQHIGEGHEHQPLSGQFNRGAKENSVGSTPSGSPFSSRKSSSVSSLPSARPGQIDNSNLILSNSNRTQSLTAEGGKLKPSIKKQGEDFELIPERLWKALVHWYGGSPSIPRQFIRSKQGHIELELNPLSIKLWKHQIVSRPPTSTTPMLGGYTSGVGVPTPLASSTAYSLPSTRRHHAHQAAFSRTTSLRQIIEFLSLKLHIKLEDMRLWHLKDENNLEPLEDEAQRLEDIGIKDDDSILIEVRGRDGTWPEEITSLCNSNDRRLSLLNSQSTKVTGITGLSNLGNTCYMNASLQCVSNTKILSEYFNKNCHLQELNRVNPIGMKGHVAKRFGDLVKDMWSSESKTIAPVRLRWTIGKYQQNFATMQQQDAQEFLDFLLSGLHEDLNRVTEKPYTELKDSDGRPDSEVAKEAWDNHCKRNKSVVVDLFHGLLKSKVTCRVCNHESVTFDPFSVLSLPLPMERSIHIEVIVIRQDGSLPTKYGLTLDVETRYSDFKANLSDLCGIPTQNLILVNIIQSQFRAIPAEEQKLKALNGSCIHAYEFHPILSSNKSQSQIPQSFSEIQRNSVGKSDSSKRGASSTSKTDSKQTKETQKEAEVAMTNIKTANVDSIEVSQESKTGLSNGNGPSKAMDTLTVPGSKGSNGNVSVSHSRQGSNVSLVSDNGSLNSMNGEIGDCQQGVIVAMHRKMVPQEVFFLSQEKYHPVLFGTPLIVGCTERTTYKELYQSVWTQVSRLVSPLPPRDSTQNHALDCDDSLKYEYPFTLKLVQRDGCWCARCAWHRSCRGCSIPCDGTVFDFAASYLAIDWDPTALHLRYQAAQEKDVREDPSVIQSQRAASEPITLNKCMEAFTREEVLGANEYYCSKCKTHQVAVKKLQIWRLPPILIVHLKRFHQLNSRWIKSQKIVDFPFHGFDPTEYLAAVPNATIKRFRALKKRNFATSPMSNGTIAELSETTSLESNATASAKFEPDRDESAVVMNGTSEGGDDDRSQNHPSTGANRRKRLESTSLVNHPIRDDNLEDFHQHRLVSGANPLDVKYNLYAYVCHSGVLSGGHYISYGKSSNAKWYCHNDSTCKETKEDQMDKSSAYILFYERENLSQEAYLPEIDPNKAIDTKELDRELEEDFKKQCSIM